MRNSDTENRIECREMLSTSLNNTHKKTPNKKLNKKLCLAVLVALMPSVVGCAADRHERVPTASDYYTETRYNTRLAKDSFRETQEINFKVEELGDQVKTSAGRVHAVWKGVK